MRELNFVHQHCTFHLEKNIKSNICGKNEHIATNELKTASNIIDISILLIFTENIWTKLIIGLILCLVVIVVWNLVANIVTKKDVSGIDIYVKENSEYNPSNYFMYMFI